MEASNLEAVVAGGRDGFGGKLMVGVCVVDSWTFDGVNTFSEWVAQRRWHNLHFHFRSSAH
jgi:hypothetical protein